MALDTIFPEDDIVLPEGSSRGDAPRPAPSTPAQEPIGPAIIAPGSYSDAAIVLLTDGQNTSGPSPLEAAQLAADRGVRVFTVGFGTKNGTIIGYSGMRMRVRLDEKTLKDVANMTLGRYFHAGSGAEFLALMRSMANELLLPGRRF